MAKVKLTPAQREVIFRMHNRGERLVFRYNYYYRCYDWFLQGITVADCDYLLFCGVIGLVESKPQYTRYVLTALGRELAKDGENG